MRKHGSFLWFVIIHAAIALLVKNFIDKKKANNYYQNHK